MATNATETRDKCINILYDIVTIVISIADITTDVIVLLSFYSQSRTNFFIISLVILIIAHVAYSAAFILRFRVLADYELWQAFVVFLVLLPFGSLVAFIIYFTEDYDSKFAKWFENLTGLDVEHGFEYIWGRKERSKMAQFMIKKLSKNIGFIIEAGIEALPQSLLQITAIVYYKEANYVSIASIFLSMFSVMSKSLVFSKAIDIKTYIWTWLCIVIDFFGIFFTLTWVFYTNDDLLQPVFWGYFSIIGQIWIYKVLIGIVPFVILGILSWFFYFYFEMVCSEIWYTYNGQHNTTNCTKIFQSILFFIVGTIGVFVAAPIGFLGLEIFNFSLFALVVFFECTDRFANYSKPQVNQLINGSIKFISKNRMWRRIRILAINYFITKDGIPSTYTRSLALNAYIDAIDNEKGIDGLKLRLILYFSKILLY